MTTVSWRQSFIDPIRLQAVSSRPVDPSSPGRRLASGTSGAVYERPAPHDDRALRVRKRGSLLDARRIVRTGGRAERCFARARHRSCGAEAADAAGATNRRRPFRGNFDNRNIDRAIDRGKSEHKWPGDEFPKAGRSEYDDQLQTVNSRTGCDTPSGSKPSA